MITLNRFIGNTDLVKLLQISIIAAREKNAALPHILIKGPAGTGKTTLAEAIAHEFGTKPLAITPLTAKNSQALRKLFLSMPGEGYNEKGQIIGKIQPQIVFSDECHQLPLVAQENLGIAMQDWKLPVTIDNVDAFEWVPRFTLIGATTLPGRLSKPFLDRFKIQAEFETYSFDESLDIVRVHSKSLGLILGEGVEEAVARRSRGVARLIPRFLERLEDAAIVAARGRKGPKNTVTRQLAETMFRDFLKVDDRGLTVKDIKILKQLSKGVDPVGLETLAVIANEDKATIENTVEPFLIQEGLMLRTKRGRVITEQGRRYLHSEGYINSTSDRPGVGRLIGAAEK